MILALVVLMIWAGFVLRINQLAVVVAACFLACWLSGMNVAASIAQLGTAFLGSRFMLLGWLVLPMLGVLESAGLRDQAGRLIARFKVATASRILLAYLLVRQGLAMVGLMALGGQVQMVRPLIAPMVEEAARRDGITDETDLEQLRAEVAAADNIGLFFGEDVFVAVSSLLLICAFAAPYGLHVTPVKLALWSLPVAGFAALVHGLRIQRLGRRMRLRHA